MSPNFFRYSAAGLLFLITLFTTWWLALVAFTLAAARWPRFYEGLFSAFLSDLVYGYSGASSLHFRFALTLIFVLIWLILESGRRFIRPGSTF